MQKDAFNGSAVRVCVFKFSVLILCFQTLPPLPQPLGIWQAQSTNKLWQRAGLVKGTASSESLLSSGTL